jgi:hypothetical protein
MEENKKVLNIVYDDWDKETDTPYANCLRYYNNGWHFWMGEGLPDHWINHQWVDPIKHPNKYIINKCKLNDVVESPNQNYYYVIGHAHSSITDMFRIKPPLSQEIIGYLKNYKNFFVMFRTEHESDNETSFVALLNFISQQSINPKQIYVVNNNDKLDEYKKKHNTNVNVHKTEFLASSSTIVLNNLENSKFNPTKEGKFFMCFNKTPKRHRLSLLLLLKKNNLLNDINWSFVPDYSTIFTNDFFERTIDSDNLKYLTNEIDYFNKLKIKVSDYEEDKGWFSEGKPPNLEGLPHYMRSVPEFSFNYENSYVNITTESMYDDLDNVIHITEKSFKPFYHYQFPIILATQGHVKMMKEKYGFDFFDDVIDHSYDDEPNQKNRLIKFVTEIIRLTNRKKEMIEFYKNNQERFENNKKIVMKNLDNDSDFLFFMNLI